LPPAHDARAGRRSAVTVGCWLLASLWAALALQRLVGFDGGIWPLVLVPAQLPYLTVGALLPIGTSLVARRWLPALLALVAAAALTATVVPRTIGRADPTRGPAVEVMTANLNEGRADPAALAVLARHVDVLAVAELTEPELAALDRTGLRDTLPYAVTNASPTSTGTGLFSRYPLTDPGRQRLLNDYVETTATVHVPHAEPVTVTVVHYCAPVDPAQAACWEYGWSRIPDATPGGPVRLLLGDLNLTLDYRALRAVLDTGYRDAAAVVGQGLAATWPYDGMPLPKVAIDHVLADRRIGVRAVSPYHLKGSDHRALAASLTLP
jgi:endonuclease/exonuclease/phosphatase (EEP) superfamily protein YafD